MNILLLEDNTTDAGLTTMGLTGSIPDCNIEIAPTLKQAKELLKKAGTFDIALLDMTLPDGNGLDLLMEIRQSELKIAVVMLTGSGNEELATVALKAGADDYIVKRQGYISKLPRVIDMAIKNFHENIQKKTEIIDVLYIEHNSYDIDLTRRHMRQYAPYINIDGVSTAEEGLSRLTKNESESKKYKLILMDYRLPGLNALEFIKIIRQERKLSTPIILVTGQGNEDVAIQALKLGASDYLMKSEKYLYRLPSLILSAKQQCEIEQNHAALAESELKYRLLADNSGDVIFVLDMDLNYTYVSPAVKTLRGFEPDEAIKQKISQVLTPESYNKVVKIIAEILSADLILTKKYGRQRSIELEMVRKDKTTVWTEVEASLLKDENNKPIGILGVARDITERRHAMNEMMKLSRAVEQSTASVIIANIKGDIEYVNPKFTQITGYSFDEVKGSNLRILKSGNTSPKEYKQLWDTIISGNNWSGEFYNKRKDGTFYWESALISPIKNDQGVVIHFLAINEDITEKKKYEEELIKAREKAEESDRLKTAFLHNISHEIRTPMNAIVGFSGFLNDPGLSPEKRKQFTDIIVQGSDQLLSIITDIISIATIEAGQEKITEKEINLNSLLLLLRKQILIKAKNQQVSINTKPFLPDNEDCIVSDETKLSQVLTNLIGNALKFTRQGHINYGYRVNDNQLEFFVEDTGIGIPAEMHEEIFKRFRQVEDSATRQYGGSGLGLSISKAYVELMGGKMWVKSAIGRGSTFYFTIPYKQVKKNIPSEKQVGNEVAIEMKEPATLLIAEDEDSNFMLLEELLSDANITIIRAVNGFQAVEICKSNQLIDVVLMDIKMPVLDGYDATRQIREFMPDLPIIAQTAYSTEVDKNKALACGCNDFISKPFSKQVLFSKIKAQLDKTRLHIC